MAESKEKVVRAKQPAKSGKGKKIHVSVDKSIDDVLSYVDKGYDLYFDGSKEGFLKLPSDVYKLLPLEQKERYMVAKEEFLGGDLIGTSTEGLQGWKRDFNITPGDPSSKLQVLGKNENYEYRWTIPERLGKRASQGWEVDKDPNIRAYDQHDSEIGKPVAKTVGGHQAPEYVLMRRRKDVAEKYRKERQAIYDGRVERAKDGYKENVEKIGAIASVD